MAHAALFSRLRSCSSAPAETVALYDDDDDDDEVGPSGLPQLPQFAASSSPESEDEEPGPPPALAPPVDESFNLAAGSPLGNIMFPTAQRCGDEVPAVVTVDAFCRVIDGGESPESVADDLAMDCDSAQAALYDVDAALELMSTMADRVVSGRVIGLDVCVPPADSHAGVIADRVWELAGIVGGAGCPVE